MLLICLFNELFNDFSVVVPEAENIVNRFQNIACLTNDAPCIRYKFKSLVKKPKVSSLLYTSLTYLSIFSL